MRSPAFLLVAALACSQAPPPQPPATPAELAAQAEVDLAFALDLYGALRSREGNLILSPLCVASGLAAAWPGARGETARQLGRVLHAASPAERTSWLAGRHVATLRASGGPVALRFASRLYVDRSVALDRGFATTTAAAWGEPPQRVDFRQRAELVRREINAWGAEVTLGRLSEIVGPSAVGESTRLVLAEAVHVLGRWEKPFHERRTKPAAFHLTRSTEKDAPTMAQVEHFRFSRSPGLKVLELDLEGRALVLTLLLPDQVDGLDELERQLTPEALAGWLKGAAFHLVDLRWPRFELGPPALSVRPALEALGMPLAFDPAAADFSGMGTPAGGPGGLWLGEISHRAFLKVDENGLEAAAAAASMIIGKGLAPPPAPIEEFHADHPFLFLLRETSTGGILFLGRMADPAPEVAARPTLAGGAARSSTALVAPRPRPSPEYTHGGEADAEGGVAGAPAFATTGYTRASEVERGCVGRSVRMPRDLATSIPSAVTVKFAIDEQGHPSRFEMLTDLPDPRWHAAIWSAVRSCAWRPGTDQAGRPVLLWTILPLKFAGQ
jgi:serpin B